MISIAMASWLPQQSHSFSPDTMSHWFRHIAEGEPCDTYLKLSSGDLARTCEMIESQRSTFDGDDALCVQNLQSIADYIHSAVVRYTCNE